MTTQDDAHEPDRLAALHRLGLLDAPADRFDHVVRLARQIFDVPTALVSLVDRDVVVHAAMSGFDQRVVPRGDSFCGTAVLADAMLVVPDASLDPRFAASPFVRDDGVRFYAGQPLVAPGGFRVGTLCIADTRPRELDAEGTVLLRDLAAWVEKELVIDSELERAAQVQAGLLPHAAPLVPGYEVAGACQPSRAVGGDFYDWAVTGDGTLVLSLVDVMGTGAGAGILAAAVRSVLRGSAHGVDVGRSLRQAGTILQADLSGAGAFATAFHAALDPATGDVRYADAGHGLTVVVRADGGSERLEATGLPLGVLPETTRGQRTTHLDPGDVLVSVSDGVLDLVDGTLAGLPPVVDAVRGAASADAAVSAVLQLAADVRERPDDLTVVAVRRA
jgi:hypothetical protein